MSEVANIWEGREIGCIISLGTGIPADRDIGKNFVSLFDTMRRISLGTEETAAEVQREMRSRYPGKKVLYRFNPPGLAGVGLEEWKEFDRVSVATHCYMVTQEEELLLCARRLCHRDGV